MSVSQNPYNATQVLSTTQTGPLECSAGGSQQCSLTSLWQMTFWLLTHQGKPLSLLWKLDTSLPNAHSYLLHKVPRRAPDQRWGGVQGSQVPAYT